MTNSKPNFLLSVVIPIYNVESYVDETIKSVLNQTLDFRKHIQLILVNDGSSDASADICLKYKNKYSANIVYIDQKNAGVSAARNAGILAAEGEYIHFLDGDDTISADAYYRMIDFMKDHTNDVDFVAIKIKFFDQIINPHQLNYKFTSSRVIYTHKEHDAPILHATSCLFKTSEIKQHTFDTRIKISEDMSLISEILVKKKAYGVVTGPTLNYRRRSNGSSAIDRKYLQKDFYQETVDLAYFKMAEEWSDGSGHIDAYMQHTLLYDIAYRLNQATQTVLTDKELNDYKNRIKELVLKFDDEVIINRRNLELYKKVYLLKWKYSDDFYNHLSLENNIHYFDDKPLLDYSNQILTLDFIDSKNSNEVLLEGYLDFDPLTDMNRCQFKCGTQQSDVRFVNRRQRQKSFLGEVLFTGGAFESVLNVRNAEGHVQFALNGATLSRVKTNRFTNLGNVRNSYTVRSGRIIHKSGYRLVISDNTIGRRIMNNVLFAMSLVVFVNLPKAREQFSKSKGRNIAALPVKRKVFELAKPLLVSVETIMFMPRALLLRLCYHLCKVHSRKPIWLISDRGMAAGDNGEAFFRYVTTRNDCPARVYFAVSKQSKDYDRLRIYGNVVDISSFKYKLLFLLSDKVISSHADIETTNPFIRLIDQYVDLFTFDFIFLQHGVTKDDLASWLNRFEKDIKIFVTSGHKEYQSIIDGDYYYNKRNIVLTGLPRFDLLQNKPAGKLILAPTYRKQLAHMKTDKNGQRGYDPYFKKSEYFEFYNNFMNDSRIINTLRNAGMQGELYIHPVLEQQKHDFKQNDLFKTMEFPYDYKNAFKEGNLLVSDHSSVVFDFAYLKKPVVYAHFDIDELFASHSYTKGSFFSDEKDGFGPVYKDYETLVEGVVELIGNECRMSDKYITRVDNFFFRVDKNNNHRVYQAILDL